jgi:hypothetical protein
VSILEGEWDDPYKAAEIADAEREVCDAVAAFLGGRGKLQAVFDAGSQMVRLREGSKP